MKNLVNIEDLRFYCIKHIPSRKFLVTKKNKCYWHSIPAAKSAFHFHTGQKFDKVRNIGGKMEFRIREFRLAEVPKKNMEFADLYKKKVGDFL